MKNERGVYLAEQRVECFQKVRQANDGNAVIQSCNAYMAVCVTFASERISDVSQAMGSLKETFGRIGQND